MTNILEGEILKMYNPVQSILYSQFHILQIAFYIHNSICESCIKVTIICLLLVPCQFQQIEIPITCVSIARPKDSLFVAGSV